LRDAFLANGIGNLHLTYIRPATSHNGLGVKNIQFDDAYPAFPLDPYGYKYDDSDLDETPSGIPGQNMGTPLAKRFNYHRILHRGSGTEYYDPSYGITTTGGTDFASHIVAWRKLSLVNVWRKASGSGLVPIFEDDP
jgi:hypothetical protein